jgi:hypothetical protein
MKRLNFLLMAVILATPALAGAAFADEKWKNYTDKTFGFSVEYPDIYDSVEEPYVDGDGKSNFGASISTGNGRYAFSVSGGQKSKGADGNSLLKEATNLEEDENGYVYGVAPIGETAKSGVNFYTYEYLDDSPGVDDQGEPDCITHVYGLVGESVMAEYTLRYQKDDAERYAEITARMDKSLKVK